MTADIFSLALPGARVRVVAPQNPLADGRTGTVTRVVRPKHPHSGTPAYVEIAHDGGRLVVSTTMLGPV